jgi:hypothetical protein
MRRRNLYAAMAALAKDNIRMSNLRHCSKRVSTAPQLLFPSTRKPSG